jgi:hypothetical protein
MSRDRSPAYVLGWLTTSANYTVVTPSAPPEHQQPLTQVRHEHVTATELKLENPSSAPGTRKDLVKTA